MKKMERRKTGFHQNPIICSVPQKFGQRSKLSSMDEFLLTMMKIRLGLLEKVLSFRFGISVTHCSKIFSTWSRALALYLKPLISLYP